ncbi:MAG: response regulator [Fuerstiella sp.]
MGTSAKPTNAIMKLAVLVDDDSMDNFLHQRVLQKSGLVEQVVVFDHVEEALEFVSAESNQIDLIFVDINMPRMDGYAFLDAFQLRKPPSESTPLIVLLSTSISADDIQRTKQYNIDIRTEQKPLSTASLKRICDNRGV